MGLEMVELAMRIEDRFRISLPDAEWSKATTAGDLYAFIRTVLRKDDPTADASFDAALWDEVRQIVADTFGVHEADVTLETRFVDDLNAG